MSMLLLLLCGVLLLCTANVREHDCWGMVRSSAAITQQICAVLIFFVRCQ